MATLAITAAPVAHAAVTANNPITPQVVNRAIVQFLQGTDSAGTYKTLYTAGSNGSRCVGIYTTNNDGSATHLLTFQVVNSSVKYGGAAITTVSSAGFANNNPAQLLTEVSGYIPTATTGAPLWPLPADSDGNGYLQMISGDTLQVTFATNLTASTLINVYATCADY